MQTEHYSLKLNCSLLVVIQQTACNGLIIYNWHTFILSSLVGVHLIKNLSIKVGQDELWAPSELNAYILLWLLNFFVSDYCGAILPSVSSSYVHIYWCFCCPHRTDSEWKGNNSKKNSVLHSLLFGERKVSKWTQTPSLDQFMVTNHSNQILS